MLNRPHQNPWRQVSNLPLSPRQVRNLPPRRAAFTLLELVLALGIGLLILYALYLAISVQLRFAESGRAAVEQATLARSLTARIASDIAPSVGTPDPGRYHSSGQGQSGASGSGTPTMGTTTPTMGSTTPTMGSTTRPTSTTTPTTGTTTPTMGSTTPSTGGTTPSTGSTDMSGTTDPNVDSSGVPVQALFGDATSLRLYVSRVPPSLTGAPTPDNGFVKSDQRVIEYWLTDKGGLARQEIPIVTATPDDIPWARGTGEEGKYVIAPEVTRVEFRYFDGTDWQDTWDSTALGEDNKTPMGPPLAIEIMLEIRTPATLGREEHKQRYRHVVAIPTANGLPQPTDDSGQMSGSGTTSGTGK